MAGRDDWLALVDKLRCNLCGNYLSYGPIFLNEGGNICGRCPTSGSIRNFAFEKLASEFTFPCRYRSNGCDKELTMMQVVDHESICCVRTVGCSLSECVWKGSFDSLVEHCQQDHADLIIEKDREFEVDLGSSYKEYKFYIFNDRLLQVSWMFDFDKKRLEFLVAEHHEELEKKKYTCILNLRFGSQTTRTEFDNDATTKILYQDMLKEHLDATSIYAQFRPRSNIDNILANSNINTTLLSSLKCFNCSLYALPPIFETVKGLVICHKCQGKTSLKIKANQRLTGLANLLTYPCKNLEAGCIFSCESSMMKDHYKVCLLQQICCEIEEAGTQCTWKGPQKYHVTHLKLSHMLLECGEPLRWDIGIHHQKLVAKFGYFYFQVSLITSTNRLTFFVTKVNGFSERFRYKIVVHSYKNSKHKIMMEASCLDLEEAKSAPSILFREQVSTFLEETKKKKYLHLKVFIFRDVLY